METNTSPDPVSPPTPEQARLTLDDVERDRASVAALSATPWPLWFTGTLATFLGTFPFMYGGMMSEQGWLLSRSTWTIFALVMIATFSALLAVAAANWRKKTGVALRWDVLPKWGTMPLLIGYPAIFVGSAYAFRATGQILFPAIASVLGVAVAVGYHLWFRHLHTTKS